MNKYALIIGIENYSYDPNQSNVRFARNDALAMVDYAEHAGFQIIDGPILDEQATRSNIIDRIDLLFDNINADDFVFIYYAGHGYHSEYGGYMIPYGHRSEQYISDGSCITYRIINERLQKKKPRNFVFFLDTCNSGSAVKDFDLRQWVQKDVDGMIRSGDTHRFTGRVLFTSSLLPEKSRCVKAYKHGLFTYHLLCALKSKPDRAEIDMEELIQLTKEYVLNDPGQDKREQTPVAYTNIQGKFYVPTYNKGKSSFFKGAAPTSINNEGNHKSAKSGVHQEGMTVKIGKGRIIEVRKANLKGGAELTQHELALAEGKMHIEANEAGEVNIVGVEKDGNGE